MAKKSHTPEQIINKLREVELLLNQGANVGEASHGMNNMYRARVWMVLVPGKK